MASYNGVAVNEADIAALQEIEAVLGKSIPKLVGKNVDFGFSVKSSHITTLALADQDLAEIPDSVWSLKSLQILSLGYNKLETIPDEIGQLVSLKRLDLSANGCREDNSPMILPGSIGNLSSLKHVDLSSNLLKEIPESIGSLSNLEVLILRDNQLATIPSSICKLSNLRELDVNFCGLGTLDAIEGLPSLQELCAAGNEITCLRDDFWSLPALQDLDLSRNHLSSIPDAIANLKSLIALDLHTNRLASIPESIGLLSSLVNLNLADNYLASLPDSIGNLANLHFLDVKGNPMSEIPVSIASLPCLQTLRVNPTIEQNLPTRLKRIAGYFTRPKCLAPLASFGSKGQELNPDEARMLEVMSGKSVSVKDLIISLGITTMEDAKQLQLILRALEKSGRICAEFRQGKKFYSRKA